MKLFFTCCAFILCAYAATAQAAEDTTGSSLTSDAMFQFMIRNYAEGEALATKAIKLNPKLPKAYYWRARARASLKKYDDALADINQGIKLAPDDAGMYYGKGLIYWGKEDLDAALTAFAGCIARNPDYKEAYELRGKVMMNQGNYAGAIKEFDIWMEKEKYDQKEVYFHRGRAWYLKGDEEKGCADMRMARKLGHAKANALIAEVCSVDASDEADNIWKEYTDVKIITRANAVNFSTRENTPESIVNFFYASRMRGDNKWEEVIPAEEKRTDRLKRQLEKYATWHLTEMKLVSKKKNEFGGWYIKIYIRIEANGRVEDGEDEVEVKQLANGTWIIISLPT